MDSVHRILTSGVAKRRTWLTFIAVTCLSGLSGLLIYTFYMSSYHLLSMVPSASILTTSTEYTDLYHSQMAGPEHNRTQIMIQRHNALRRKCQKLHGNDHQFLTNTNFNLRHFIYDDKYKVVYCFIPKVACTNLKRAFLILTGQIKQTDPLEIPHGQAHGPMQFKYLKFLRNFKNSSDVMYRLQNYKKVIFVREPFERLLSAWRNKFGPTGEDYFKKSYGRYIVKHFRENPSNESLAKGNDVSFKKFIQYIIELEDSKQSFDMHWKKYTDLCYPCEVDYDFIGRYDSIGEDIDLLLDELGVSNFLRFPKRNETYKKAKTVDVLTDFYKEIPNVNLKRIKDIYANDSFLFDFSIPSALQKLK